MTANLWQNDDDFWTLDVERESGLVESIQIGKLSKEQAMREAVLRYSCIKPIHVWDKHALKAYREGKVRGILPTQKG